MVQALFGGRGRACVGAYSYIHAYEPRKGRADGPEDERKGDQPPQAGNKTQDYGHNKHKYGQNSIFPPQKGGCTFLDGRGNFPHPLRSLIALQDVEHEKEREDQPQDPRNDGNKHRIHNKPPCSFFHKITLIKSRHGSLRPFTEKRLYPLGCAADDFHHDGALGIAKGFQDIITEIPI